MNHSNKDFNLKKQKYPFTMLKSKVNQNCVQNNNGYISIQPCQIRNSQQWKLLNSKNICENIKINYSFGGTYLAMEGPQFSPYAESKLYIDWGCDVIGMTNMPEAKLAREAEIRYCSISMVTDYDCWHPDHDKVDLSMIIKTLNDNVDNSKNFIKNFSSKYYEGVSFENDKTSNILDTSIITKKEFWDKDLENNLTNILKRYKKNSNASK